MTTTNKKRPAKRKQCGAKTRRGSECRLWAMVNGRCKRHGGASLPPGPSHPTYKHGKYSKLMPAGIVENYEALLSGSDVTQLRDDLAALDALLIERWGRVDNGASIGFWNLIDRAADEIVEAIEREDQTQVSELVKKLTKTIKSGKRTVGLMDEIARLHVQKSVVAAREWKRQVDMKQMVTSEQMLVTMTMLAEAVRNACSDTSIPRNRIAAEVAKAVLRFRDGETANQN